jgi:endonuclease III
MAASVSEFLDLLQAVYGKLTPEWPTDPYDFLVWWHCGYPASDRACARGWESLRAATGISAKELLAASMATLAAALAPGGMVPEKRAMRLKEIASRIVQEFDGDLRAALAGPLAAARKTLKKFPNIGDPGADRILLFAGIAPLAAIPSNCPHVLVRLRRGRERENYGVTYKEAQEAVAADVPETFPARQGAFLLLKRHGQEVCKMKPRCDECELSANCAYFGGHHRGRATTGVR